MRRGTRAAGSQRAAHASRRSRGAQAPRRASSSRVCAHLPAPTARTAGRRARVPRNAACERAAGAAKCCEARPARSLTAFSTAFRPTGNATVSGPTEASAWQPRGRGQAQRRVARLQTQTRERRVVAQRARLPSMRLRRPLAAARVLAATRRIGRSGRSASSAGSAGGARHAADRCSPAPVDPTRSSALSTLRGRCRVQTRRIRRREEISSRCSGPASFRCAHISAAAASAAGAPPV